MSKKDAIDAVAEHAELTKEKAGVALDASHVEGHDSRCAALLDDHRDPPLMWFSGGAERLERAVTCTA